MTDVYYSGTKQQWEKIWISYGNYNLKKATIHYKSKMPGKDEVTSVTIRLNNQKVTGALAVKVGKSYKFKAAVSPKDAKDKKVKWKPSNKSVATVSSTGKVKVKKITIKGKKTMKVKKSQTLTAGITPAAADNQKLTWKSSNKKVATVNSKGKVTAKKKGMVKITAKAKDGSGKKAVFKITVKA